MMNNYRYRGRNQKGQVVKGSCLGESKGQVAQALEAQGILLSDLTVMPAWITLGGALGRKRLSVKTLAPICRQLAFALTSGITLINSLVLVQSEANSKVVGIWLDLVLAQLQQGKSFRVAIGKIGWEVPNMLMEFLIIGENRGDLGWALTQAADYLESQVKLRRALLGALLYPALLSLVILVVILAMLLVVGPALAKTYQNFGVPIPPVTQGLIFCGHFLNVYGLWLLLVGGILLLGLIGAKRWVVTQAKVQGWLKKWFCKVPLVRKIVTTNFYVTFSRSLGELLEGGILSLNALVILEQNNPHFLFQEELEEITKQSSQGKSLSEGLSHCTFVPLMARQMIEVGEESGRLGAMLLQSSRYYEAYLQLYTSNLAKVLEPLLIVFLGMVVLFIAGSIFLPMVTSYQYIL